MCKPEEIDNQSLQPALVVDLDKALLKTNVFHEALLKLAQQNPQRILSSAFWAAKGSAEFSASIAENRILAADSVPIDHSVLDVIRSAKINDQKIALVSDMDNQLVDWVVAGIPLFAEDDAKPEIHHVTADERTEFLVGTYGKRNFDYIGSSKSDVPIWKEARRAITARATESIRKAAEASNREITHVSPPKPLLNLVAKAIRPHQWSKNLLLFLPLLASHEIANVLPVLIAFLAFCMTASAAYVINDLSDLASDRAHPRKRHRPFASGQLQMKTGLRLAMLLLLGAVLLGFATGKLAFLLVLAAYFAATLAYSVWLKRKLIVDVIALAGLYSMRIIAGAVAGSVILSPWMLGFSMFLFLALAAVKRQAELEDQLAHDRPSVGRAYEVEDLPILRAMAISAGHATIVVLALYISSDDVQNLYATPSLLWGLCPILLYWLIRMVMKAHRRQMTDDPIVFAVSDRVSWLLILCSAVFVVFASV